MNAANTVKEKLKELREELSNDSQMAYVQRIDNVLFCHGGISDEFVRNSTTAEYYDDVDRIIEEINRLDCSYMWNDASPIWYRPQYYRGKLYKPEEFLQVVGHTPVSRIERRGNIISCDVFSTDYERKPIGANEFLLLDTETWEFTGVKA